MKNLEIERKWLMNNFPELPPLFETEQEQGYLSFLPNTVRIRKICDASSINHRLTFKSKGTLSRQEVEMDLPAQQYLDLLPLLLAPIVRKKHKTYALPTGHILECSLVDEGEPTSFFYAEVEFDSEEEAVSFIPPSYFGLELTHMSGYSMGAYCEDKAHFSAKLKQLITDTVRQ